MFVGATGGRPVEADERRPSGDPGEVSRAGAGTGAGAVLCRDAESGKTHEVSGVFADRAARKDRRLSHCSSVVCRSGPAGSSGRGHSLRYSEVDGGEVTSRLRARGRAVGAAGETSPAWKAREADAEAGQCVRGARGSGGRRSPSAGGERRVDHPAGAACAAAASTWPGPPLEARGRRPGRRPQAGSPAWLPVLTVPTANGGRRVHRPRLGRSHAPVRAVDTRRASRCTPARPQSYVCLKVGDSEPSRVKCRALSLSDAGAFWGDGGPVAASRSPGTSYQSPGPTRC